MEEIAGAGGSRREVLEIGRAAYTSFSDSFSDMSSSFSESSMYDAESSSDMTADEFPAALVKAKRRRRKLRASVRRRDGTQPTLLDRALLSPSPSRLQSGVRRLQKY